MPRVSSETYCDRDNDILFKYTVNVDKEGWFSTTLPPEITDMLEEGGIDMSLHRNRIGNKGYYWDKTFKGLCGAIGDVMKEYLSRELVAEYIVIQYSIQTQCSYCLNPRGEVVPNGSTEWTETEDYEWKSGNREITSTNRDPFGLLIYAKPSVRRDYLYRSKRTTTEYEQLRSGGDIAKKALDSGHYLKWLNDVCGMYDTSVYDIQEVKYTEHTAKFFVDLIKGICNINEKVKDFIDPESIVKIAESGQKLLG